MRVFGRMGIPGARAGVTGSDILTYLAHCRNGLHILSINYSSFLFFSIYSLWLSVLSRANFGTWLDI